MLPRGNGGVRGRGRFGRFARSSRPTKIQKYEVQHEPIAVTPIGLYTEGNRQTLSMFWNQLYQFLAPDFPLNACYIINGTPTAPIVPTQPVMMNGLSAAEKRLWEHTVLRSYSSDLEYFKTELKSIQKERVSLCSKIRQYVTPLLHDRLMTQYAIDNVEMSWMTCDSVINMKLMISNVFNNSKAVLSQNRQFMVRDHFESVRMNANESFDKFTLRFRQEMDERDSMLIPLSHSEKCFHFLKKLNDSHESIKVEIASGESKNEIRRSAGLPPIEGFGYPSTLEELIVSVRASQEASVKQKSNNSNSVSFVTTASVSKTTTRPNQTKLSSRGRGRSGPSKPSTPSPNANAMVGGKYPDVLVHLNSGIKKKWSDMDKDDNPIDYGRPTCKTCLSKGTAGFHFTKFHV